MMVWSRAALFSRARRVLRANPYVTPIKTDPANKAMNAKKSVTRVRRRRERCRATGESVAGERVTSAKGSRHTDRRKVLALPVRHQGEEGVSPGQREQVLIWSSCVTDQFASCAISVTKQSIFENLWKTDAYLRCCTLGVDGAELMELS